MIKIVKLTKELAEKYTDQLCNAEKIISDTSGDLYANCWTSKNFLAELPGKWTYSRIVFEDNEVIGFYIASVKERKDGMKYLHGHRTGVLPSHRSSTIFLDINNNIIKEAQQNGIKWFTGYVAEINKDVMQWDVRVLGYKIIRDKSLLMNFIGELEPGCSIDDKGRILQEGNPEYTQYFLVKEI